MTVNIVADYRSDNCQAICQTKYGNYNLFVDSETSAIITKYGILKCLMYIILYELTKQSVLQLKKHQIYVVGELF